MLTQSLGVLIPGPWSRDLGDVGPSVMDSLAGCYQDEDNHSTQLASSGNAFLPYHCTSVRTSGLVISAHLICMLAN